MQTDSLYQIPNCSDGTCNHTLIFKGSPAAPRLTLFRVSAAPSP
jgi:hypothetical protein